MAKSDPIEISTSPLDGATLFKIDGEIDFSRSPKLRTKLLDTLNAGVPKLVVDLTGVPYMDSSGVATLVEALQVQRRKGNKLVLCGLQPKVRGIFEIARLDMVFTITTDSEAGAKA
jgi:anti-sigma B factor antagonist